MMDTTFFPVDLTLDQLRSMKPGESIVYFIGKHLPDRNKSLAIKNRPWDVASKAERLGLGVLVRRPVNGERPSEDRVRTFEYIFQRTTEAARKTLSKVAARLQEDEARLISGLRMERAQSPSVVQFPARSQ